MPRRSELFGFPNPVDEVSARLVAGGVVALCAATIATRQPWLLALLAYGFVARVLTGPTLSPWGRAVTQVIRPRLAVRPRWVPGPPKRFAQGIGATLSVTAAVVLAVTGSWTVPVVLVAMIAGAALLESAFGLCLGCVLFGALIRIGVIPESVCEACNSLAFPSRS